MATSGSWNYSVTAESIVQFALEDLGVIEPGQTVPSAFATMGLQRLNLLAKQWQANTDLAPGLKIWTRQRVNLFLAKGQQTYLIGPASTDARAATTYGRTTLSADEATSQTTLSITSNTDTTTFPGTTVTMTASDIIGIELNDGTIHWSAISGTPASTADVALGITGAASAGNYVWWFTSRAQRLPLVEHAVIRDENRQDTELLIYRDARSYDSGVLSKYDDARPTAILVEPLTLNTRITLNSQPTDVTDTIVLTALYPAEDYDSSANDIAFPQEWYAALEWELAFRMAPAFGRWSKDMEMNRQGALTMARTMNPEKSQAYYQPYAED
jgi:hypothetical protein